VPCVATSFSGCRIENFLYIAGVLLHYKTEKMSKKVKNKKATKSLKPATKGSKPAPKKSGKTAAKPVAKKAAKPAPKKAAKSASKSSAKKVVKKNVVTKAVKPAPKKSAPAKKNKPATKGLTKAATKPNKTVAKAKVLTKSAKAPSKPLTKGKPAAKAKAPAKPLAKKTAAKPVGKVKESLKPVAKPAAKSVKAPAKPAAEKAEKPKKEKEEKTIVPDKVKSLKDKPKRGKGGRKPKNKNGDDDEPEIVHDELIEQIIQTTRRQPKQPKGPKIIKTFVNPHESLSAALPDPPKKGSIPKKEPKGKFELEYVVRTSAGILYELLTTPSGLSEWFADDVNIRDGIFTFYWDGSEQKAKLLGFKEEKYLRLQWLDKPDGYYFEFRIERDELTGDISLMIVDFADESSDMQTSKLLWDSQVGKLLNVLGSN
jgi:uncharacterized protein YndB with AHSA1/START domain